MMLIHGVLRRLKKTFLCHSLLLLVISLATPMLYGQSEYYLIKESSGQFKAIENLLLQEQTDSVLQLTADILAAAKRPRTRGTAFFYQGQAADSDIAAINCFKSAQASFGKAKFNTGLAMAVAKEAEIHFFLQDFGKADSLFASAAPLAEQERLLEVAIDIYQYQAMVATQQNQPAEVILSLKKASSLIDQEKQVDLYRDLTNQLATSYQANGKLDSAVFYFEELIRISQAQGNNTTLLSDYAALSNLYKERGDHEQAQAFLFKALPIAEAAQDSFQLIQLYTDIGEIYAAQQLPDAAEPYYQKALSIASDLERIFAEANLHLQLSKLYQQQKLQAQSIRYAEIALHLYQELNNRSKSVETLLLLSALYQTQLDYDEAKVILQEALAVRDELEDQQGTLAIKKSLAALEIEQGNPQEALTIAEECLAAYQDMGDAKGMRDAYRLLSDAYAKLGAFAKAYTTQGQFMVLNDSLISIERALSISESNARYDLAQQEKTLAQANEEIQKQRVTLLRRNNQILALAAGFVLIVLSGLFLFYVYRKNKLLSKRQIEVLEKEKESQKLKAMIQGEEKERKRFAQELHDGLGAVLAGVKMSISKIKPQTLDQSTQSAYQKASDLIDNASRTVREIAHNLMPYALEQQGLIFAMEDICQNFRANRAVDIDLIHYGDEQDLNDSLKITTFRIAQELLSNSLKHAKATSIIVQLTIEPNELMLIIEDDGVGFEPQKVKSGIGLSNIQSRVNYLNGEMTIDTHSDQGSTFTIVLPIN